MPTPTPAIATTTSRSNLDALMQVHVGPGWASGFDAVVCGEDVERKKPDPAVYDRALRILGLAPQAVFAPQAVAAVCTGCGQVSFTQLPTPPPTVAHSLV